MFCCCSERSLPCLYLFQHQSEPVLHTSDFHFCWQPYSHASQCVMIKSTFLNQAYIVFFRYPLLVWWKFTETSHIIIYTGLIPCVHELKTKAWQQLNGFRYLDTVKTT